MRVIQYTVRDVGRATWRTIRASEEAWNCPVGKEGGVMALPRAAGQYNAIHIHMRLLSGRLPCSSEWQHVLILTNKIYKDMTSGTSGKYFGPSDKRDCEVCLYSFSCFLPLNIIWDLILELIYPSCIHEDKVNGSHGGQRRLLQGCRIVSVDDDDISQSSLKGQNL